MGLNNMYNPSPLEAWIKPIFCLSVQFDNLNISDKDEVYAFQQSYMDKIIRADYTHIAGFKSFIIGEINKRQSLEDYGIYIFYNGLKRYAGPLYNVDKIFETFDYIENAIKGGN